MSYKAMEESDFPVISMAKLGDFQSKEYLRIYEASIISGFFYLSETGLPESLIQRAIRASRTFFQLPLETKMSFCQEKQLVEPKTSRGYIPLYTEMFDPKLGPGCHEVFNVGLERPLSDLPFTGPNLWPPDSLVPDLKDSLLELQDQILNQVSPVLLQGFALALGLHPSYFQHFFQEPVLDHGANYYPAGQGTIGKHTDSGMFTMLIQEQLPTPSLRVCSNGEWKNAPAIPGTMAINIGDTLQRWSGDLFVSTPHAVKHTAPYSRISLPHVLFPSLDAQLSPIGRPQEKVRAIDILTANHDKVWVLKMGQGRIEQLESDPELA